MKNLPFVSALISVTTLVIGLSLPTQAQPRKRTVSPVGTDQLPFDPAVRTGRLTNGFTYFIRHNTEPKNRVLFYLANKVGSILETDEQQGLAHFMEHMNFNGTTHFPKNELIGYLQQAGVRFGADINAYTGFDETVYQLPLPANKPDIVQNGIEIMHDWAQGALLETGEINRERGVILEEKRVGKGAGERMQRQFLPILFNQSRYARRLPIGTEAVLVNFKPETLRQFYKDWYRPDLQALIVVGDVDVDQLEKTIRAKFSDLKNPVGEKPRIRYTIPLTGRNQFLAITDREETNTVFQVLIKHPQPTLKTKADYRALIVRELMNSMLGTRFQDLSSQANPPFIVGSAGINDFLGGLSTYGVMVRAKPGGLETGFKAAWRETERVVRHGFTETELSRAKKHHLLTLETTLENKGKNSSAGYMNEYLAYFLHDKAAPGIDLEYALTKANLNSITLADINTLARQYVSPTNRDVILMGPEKARATLPQKATVDGWMREVAQEKMAPYADDFTDSPLLSSPPLSGKISSEEKLDSLGATRLTLSNGATVLLKPTHFSNNDVTFNATSAGGASLYPDADYQSASYAAMITSMSGIGQYNFAQLGKYFADKRMGMGVGIDDNSEGIDGFTTNNDLDSFLQLVYLYFTAPKADTTAFNNVVRLSRSGLENRANSPGSVYDDTVSAVLGNYNVRRTGPSLAKVAQMNLSRSHQIYTERFANAADFQFSFVGDYDEKTLRPLIEKYIASLPATSTRERAKNLNVHPVPGVVTKTVYKGVEKKASVRLTFSGPYAYSERMNRTMDALKAILQIRLTERLREEEGGVYSPMAAGNYTKQPESRYIVSMLFDCAPQAVEKLIAAALDEVNKLKTNGPDAVNLEKFKAEARLSQESQLRSNSFWTDYFAKQYLNQNDLNEVLHADDVLKRLTRQDVQEAARQYLSGRDLIRVVLMPETSVSRNDKK